MKKIFLTAFVIFALAAPVFVSAQGLKDAGKILDKAADSSKTGLSSDFAGTVATVIKTVLALVGTVFLVLTIYAGIMWMTAQGEEDRITKAKDMIKAAVIGLVIIMSAYAITAFVTSRLTGGLNAPATDQNNLPAPGPDVPDVPDVIDPVLGCCRDTNTGAKLENRAESTCIFATADWTAGACPPDILGCCLDTNTHASMQTTEFNCRFSGADWNENTACL